MKTLNLGFIVLFGLFLLGVCAQEDQREGIQFGSFILRPRVDGALVYDDRVEYNQATDEALDDVYSDVSVGGELYNEPALINLSARVVYGYRSYKEQDHKDSDFYGVGAGIGSDEYALRWGLSGNVSKSLGYDVEYDPETGEGPGPIITDEVNRQWTATGDLEYALALSEETAIVPSYRVDHYFQEFESSGTAEWQIHQLGLIAERAWSEKTTLYAGGTYSLQVNDTENGSVSVLGGGFRSQLTDKTSFNFLGGVGYADYEVSGEDISGLIDLRARWQVTSAIGLYIFGGNSYQPGYGGGSARMLYRLGYGGDWILTPKWSISGQVLHSDEDQLGSEPGTNSDDGVSHFLSTALSYRMTSRLNFSLRGSYANDGLPVDKTLISLSAGYIY